MDAEGKFRINHFSKEAIKPETILQEKGTFTATAASLYAAGALNLEVNVYHDHDCPAASAPSTNTNPYSVEGFVCTCHPEVEISVIEADANAKRAA